MRTREFGRVSTFGLVLAASLLASASTARAQDETPPPSQDEMKAKVREIDRLMRQAEEALVASLSAAEKAKLSDQAMSKLLDEKARSSTGKSADELRKLAESGSEEAGTTLKQLMKESSESVSRMTVEKLREVLDQAGGASGGAGAGVRKLLDETKDSSQGVTETLQWVLDQAKATKKDKPEKEPQKPESKTEPPKDPKGEIWVAQLPPQIRKAYESQDWDSIPPRWRTVLRAWTKKMASELEKSR
jgi:hypothetical protein